MRKKIIEGVKPFNDFFFRSCYYHQLISGLSCFGIEKDNILLNSYLLTKDNFETETKILFSEKELEKAMGYKTTRCNITQKSLIKNINENRPVIIGVDCYYLENRKDTFNISHSPHYILVYGYDLDSKELYVVEHNYLNSFVYTEQVISMDMLLHANKMFKLGELKKKKTSVVLEKIKETVSLDLYKFIDVKDVEENHTSAIMNLKDLREVLFQDISVIENNSEKIVKYLQNIKQFYYSVACTKKVTDVNDIKILMTKLISGYANILSVFWKMNAYHNYEFAKKNIERIIQKIDELTQTEIILYEKYKEKNHG